MLTEKPFYTEVFEVVKQIPEGKVTTYGAIADFLARGSARIVGWAMNQTHRSTESIPAHRVVNRKGELTGRNHFDLPTLMQERLEAEGLVIKNHKIEDFQKHFWHPQEMIDK